MTDMNEPITTARTRTAPQKYPNHFRTSKLSGTPPSLMTQKMKMSAVATAAATTAIQ
jgi:hypothetical protein